jgi:hypothetical protein
LDLGDTDSGNLPAEKILMDISDRFSRKITGINDPKPKKYAMSGVAIIESDEQCSVALVCHDNKNGEVEAEAAPRFGIVRLDHQPATMTYKALEWPGAHLPNDLEGLTAVPIGDRKAFFALQSSGEVFYFELKKDLGLHNYAIIDPRPSANLSDISVEKVGHKVKLNLEGFSVQNLSDESHSSSDFLAVWAHRGDDTIAQGIIFWGTVDADNSKFGCLDWHEVVVPWPPTQLTCREAAGVKSCSVTYARQISGLKVLPDGTLLIASALDPGDAGPFLGAVYDAGVFEIKNNSYRFHARRGLELREIYSTGKKSNTEGHKIEGMELLDDPQSLVMVTDDENFGPAIAVVSYSP